MGEAAAGEAFAEAAGVRVGLPNASQNSSVPASVSAPSMVSHTRSGIAEASSKQGEGALPLLCRPAMASVLFSDQVMASTRQVLSRPGCDEWSDVAV